MSDDEFSKRYMYLDIPFTNFKIQVKLDDEGVVIDVFDDNGDVVATTYKFYEELGLFR